jgi:ATP phosphoribosyltransferase
MINLKLALPKGRMQSGVFDLLAGAGIRVRHGTREYRPSISVEGFDVKLLKPQTIVQMLGIGTRDLGFAGADWVAELDVDLVEVLDTGLDRVQLVAAAPPDILVDGELPERCIVVASEFQRLTQKWIDERGFGDRFVRSYGATEVFPPEDADCITDISASGATLAANGLEVIETLLESSTRLYANPTAWADPKRRERIEGFAMLIKSVIDARGRIMIEMNVCPEKLESLVELLPCMREPTVSPLHHGAGYAVKAAVPRESLPSLIPRIKAAGGTDIVATEVAQIVA